MHFAVSGEQVPYFLFGSREIQITDVELFGHKDLLK
jgi:hypothetical protein